MARSDNSTLVRMKTADLQTLRRIYAETGESMISILHNLIEDKWAQLQAIPESEKRDRAEMLKFNRVLTSRDLGTNPRAKQTNPRAQGTNPRALRVAGQDSE